MSSTNRLLNRSAKITVTKPNGFFLQGGNEIQITDLRIQFMIEKNLDKNPNTADVVITNLSEQSRAELQEKPLHILIEAGHDDNLKRIFVGDLTFGKSVKKNADWETTLQVGDGARATKFARVAKSFRRGVTPLAAIQELAKSMGLKIPKNIDDADELLVPFQVGLTLQGKASTEMTRILSAKGMDWSIQDGRLIILRPGEVRTDTAFVLDQDAGMIDQPEFGAPAKKGKPPVLTSRSILYPELSPGGKMQLRSQFISGLFKLTRVVHSGDTHGADWVSEMESLQV